MRRAFALAALGLALGCSSGNGTGGGGGSGGSAGSGGGVGTGGGSATGGGTGTGGGGAADAGVDGGTDGGTGGGPGLPDGGVMNHRPTSEQCPMERAPGFPTANIPGCTSDDQCDAGVNGRCNPGMGGALLNLCTYDECFSDSDCESGVPCACRSEYGANTCLTASGCRVDSDCGPGGFCSLSPRSTLSCVLAYQCHTPGDQCENDGDCADAGNGFCAYDGQAHRWACAFFCAIP